MELMTIGLDSGADGETAFEALDDPLADKRHDLEDLALVYRTDRGRVKVK